MIPLTPTEIATLTGDNPNTVRTWLRRHEIQPAGSYAGRNTYRLDDLPWLADGLAAARDLTNTQQSETLTAETYLQAPPSSGAFAYPEW